MSRSAGTLIAVGQIWVLGAAGMAGADCDLWEEDESRTTYRAIGWEDFQGKRPGRFGNAPHQLTTRASIATSIRVEPYGVALTQGESGRWTARPANLCARAFMYKDRSGHREDEREDKALAHEQGHFDLTEVFTRELRVRLAGLEHTARDRGAASRGLKERVERDYRGAVKRWRETQERYDRETRHGVKRTYQRKWFEEIDERLAASALLARGGGR